MGTTRRQFLAAAAAAPVALALPALDLDLVPGWVEVEIDMTNATVFSNTVASGWSRDLYLKMRDQLFQKHFVPKPGQP